MHVQKRLVLSNLREVYHEFKEKCPDLKIGIVKFKEELVTLLDDNDVDQIVYKQWVSTDRSTLETRCASAEEFVDFSKFAVMSHERYVI